MRSWCSNLERSVGTPQTAALEAARQALENTRERMPARPQQSGTSSFTYVNTRSSAQQSRYWRRRHCYRCGPLTLSSG